MKIKISYNLKTTICNPDYYLQEPLPAALYFLLLHVKKAIAATIIRAMAMILLAAFIEAQLLQAIAQVFLSWGQFFSETYCVAMNFRRFYPHVHRIIFKSILSLLIFTKQ